MNENDIAEAFNAGVPVPGDDPDLEFPPKNESTPPVPADASPMLRAVAVVAYAQSRSILDLPIEEFKAELANRDETRRELLQWLKKSFIEGIDYARLHVVSKSKCPEGNSCMISAHWSKPVLLKPGAEKINGKLGIVPEWPGLEGYEKACMEGKEIKQIVLRCQGRKGDGSVAGYGIGARTVADDYGDLNKSLKMAKKSSLEDMSLTMAGLSEVFTVDLMDVPIERLDPDRAISAPATPPRTEAPQNSPPAQSQPPSSEPYRPPSALPGGGIKLSDKMQKAIFAVTAQAAKDWNLQIDIGSFIHWIFGVNHTREVTMTDGSKYMKRYGRDSNGANNSELYKYACDYKANGGK